MVSHLPVEKTDLPLAAEDHQDNASEPVEDVALHHDCLVNSYLLYLKAAGYSNIPQGVRRFAAIVLSAALSIISSCGAFCPCL
jgi:hypothetical protein